MQEEAEVAAFSSAFLLSARRGEPVPLVLHISFLLLLLLLSVSCHCSNTAVVVAAAAAVVCVARTMEPTRRRMVAAFPREHFDAAAAVVADFVAAADRLFDDTDDEEDECGAVDRGDSLWVDGEFPLAKEDSQSPRVCCGLVEDAPRTSLDVTDGVTAPDAAAVDSFRSFREAEAVAEEETTCCVLLGRKAVYASL